MLEISFPTNEYCFESFNENEIHRKSISWLVTLLVQVKDRETR